jgi:hypothetical protein
MFVLAIFEYFELVEFQKNKIKIFKQNNELLPKVSLNPFFFGFHFFVFEFQNFNIFKQLS